jgi:preprotein translocase subunit SecG
MLLTLLLVIEIIVSIMLVVVVLLQQSEGGALGIGGGGPSGFMTARGAGDLLTRTTWILATIFFVLIMALTLISGHQRDEASVVDRLKVNSINPAAATPPPQPAPAGQAQPQGAPQPAPFQAPAPTVHNPFLGEAPAAPAPAPSK